MGAAASAAADRGAGCRCQGGIKVAKKEVLGWIDDMLSFVREGTLRGGHAAAAREGAARAAGAVTGAQHKWAGGCTGTMEAH